MLTKIAYLATWNTCFKMIVYIIEVFQNYFLVSRLTVETVTRRRKAVSTREHLLMAWHRKIDRPGGDMGHEDTRYKVT